MAILVSYIEFLNMIDTFPDDSTSSDDDDTRISAMAVSKEIHINFQTNLKYIKVIIKSAHFPRISYAICNSGANFLVAIKIAKIESIIVRAADLVEDDP